MFQNLINFLLKGKEYPLSLNLGLLLLRLFFGLSMSLNHGYSTLITFLNGGTAYPDPLGIGSRTTMGLMTFTEFFCAIAVVFGLWTRLALIPMVIGFSVAVFIHHFNDPYSVKELSFMYFSAFSVLLFTGPGKYSLDNRFSKAL